jgi:signal transduction histidine kinase
VTRGSVRLRLTVLFASLFLAAGAGLLGITYGLVSHATNGIIVARFNGTTIVGQPASGQPTASGGSASDGSGSVGSGSLGSGSLGLGTSGGSGTDVTLPNGIPGPGTLNAATTQYASDTRSAEKDALLLYSGIALGIMLVVSAVLGWFAAGRALRPLRRITAAARRISVTNLHERLALAGPDDDVRELADMIDSLFARLDASLQAQRQFVANASHELRTPLARSRTLLEVALRDPGATPDSLRAACERAIAAGAEQERLLEALLILARGQRGLARREPVDLAAITRDVLAARGAEITARRLDVQVELSPALLAGDAALAERAVANLVDNAFLHNVPGGTVWVSVESDGGRAVLTVGNTGPEIGPDEVGRLLLPFQRGGPAGSSRTRSRSRSGGDDGLGLGLSIVAAIATAHESGLSITPRLDGGGLTARLAFPPAPAITLIPPVLVGGGRTDDECTGPGGRPP